MGDTMLGTRNRENKADAACSRIVLIECGGSCFRCPESVVSVKVTHCGVVGQTFTPIPDPHELDLMGLTIDLFFHSPHSVPFESSITTLTILVIVTPRHFPNSPVLPHRPLPIFQASPFPAPITPSSRQHTIN
jgi:hypothetical protein